MPLGMPAQSPARAEERRAAPSACIARDRGGRGRPRTATRSAPAAATELATIAPPSRSGVDAAARNAAASSSYSAGGAATSSSELSLPPFGPPTRGSRLPGDERSGGVVPRVEAALVERIESPGGDRAEVERGRADPADVAHLRQELEQHGGLLAAALGRVPEAGADERRRERHAGVRRRGRARRAGLPRPGSPRTPRRSSGSRRRPRASCRRWRRRPRPRPRRCSPPTRGCRRGSSRCRRSDPRPSRARSCRCASRPPRRRSRRRGGRRG